MEFQTEYNRTKVPTNSGDKFLPQYIETIDAKGKTILKETTPKNVYEMIQASAEECEVYNILERYAQSGDESILNQRQAVYGNFIDVPKTPIELQNTLMQADKAFNSLDKEVRELFENDSGVFKQSILDGSFESKIAKLAGKEKAEAPKNEAPKTEAPKTEAPKSEGVNLGGNNNE